MKRIAIALAGLLGVTVVAFVLFSKSRPSIPIPTDVFALAAVAPDSCPPPLTGDFDGPWGSQTWTWYALACGDDAGPHPRVRSL